VSIRARIFLVIGLVVAAAFVQTLFVVHLGNQRLQTTDDLNTVLWRYENQSTLVQLVVELDSTQRGCLVTGEAAVCQHYERLWEVYERTSTLLPQYIQEPEVKKELAALDALIREWHANASLALMPEAGSAGIVVKIAALSTPRVNRLRGELDRFASRERNRLTEQSSKAHTAALNTTLLALAIPAMAIVLLLLLLAFIARILLDPLAAVAKSARQISGGNFNVSLPPPSRDEIGALTSAFRDMTVAVERRQSDLTDALNREREVSQLLDTQRAKAEREHERLLATISTVPVAIVIFDAESGRVVLQNRTADALIGSEPEDAEAQRAFWASFKVTERDGSPCKQGAWGPERILRGDVIVGEEQIVPRLQHDPRTARQGRGAMAGLQKRGMHGLRL
jgi:CHASE3 domain sensor protein